MLRKQIEVFQGLMSVTQNSDHVLREAMQASRFSKKKCEHSQGRSSPFNFQWPDAEQVTVRILHESAAPSTPPKLGLKHYDIKPNLNRSEAERRLSRLYKSASFESHIVLVEDKANEYRVEVYYTREAVVIEVVNFAKGETNFVYAAKLNEQLQEGNQRIS
jgi:hypothetical protein